MARRVEGRSDRLLDCARAEFMEMGFQEASLRVIAARADTSTGSIYTRFKDKEGLFHALVDDTVGELLGLINKGQQAFADMPPREQSGTVFSYGPDLWEELLDYIYDHWDVFRLLVRCSDISCFDDMMRRITEIEEDYTNRFLRATGSDAVESGRLSPMMIHILSEAFYSGLFETVRHGMAKEEAAAYMRQLRRFFLHGWMDLLNSEPR